MKTTLPFPIIPIISRLAGCLLLAFAALCPAQDKPAADPPGPPSVGNLGYFSKLVFEGNTIIPSAALRRGLTLDLEAVYASHPAAALADFLPTLGTRLTRGYLASGFPEAKVEAALVPGPEGDGICVWISEGPRYLMGKITLEGAKTISADKLREMLLPRENVPKGPSLIAQVREIMDAHKDRLPAPDSKAAEEMLETLKQQDPTAKTKPADADKTPAKDGDTLGALLESLNPSASSDPAWTPGKPVHFEQDATDPLADRVRRHLAELGHPLVRLHTAYQLNADGTADLIIRIEDEGPLPVIGRILVVGAKEHRPEEIIEAAGLAGGRPLTPEVLDQALLALWDSGRFFPFAITPVLRGADAREVDLIVQTREIPGVPRLDAKLTPEAEVARRFIHHFNQWMFSGSDDDLLVTVDAGDGLLTTLGFSGHDGLVLDALSPDPNIRATASVAKDCIRLRLKREGRDSVIRLPLPMNRFKSNLQLLPDPETGKGSFGVGFGFSSLANTSGLPTTIITLSPAIPFIKPEAFRRDGDRFVEYVHGDRTILRLDATTAMPVSTETTRIEFRKGAVKELQQAITAELDRPGAAGGLGDWIEGARTLATLANEEGKLGPFAVKTHQWLNIAAIIAKPEITQPFADLWTKWETPETPETFFIPLDPELLKQTGTINLLVSFGAIGFAEMLAPPDSWVAKLAREAVFIQGGNTRYTERTLRELLDDPGMGPYGCLLAARVLSYFDPPSAAPFLHKARSQATAAAFRRDWQLVLGSPAGIGRALSDTLAALGAIPPAQQEELSVQLAPAQAAWLRDMLARIRTLPAATNLSEWLAPPMDELWNRHLQENFLLQIERTLNPPPDPKLIAATVDGMTLSRAWLGKLEDAGYYRVLLPRLEPDPAQPWTRRPLLAESIRLLLWKKSWESPDASATPPGDPTSLALDLTAEDLQRIAKEASDIATGVPQPDAAELAGWWRDHGPALGRQCHLHSVRATAEDEQEDALKHTTRLVRETAILVRDGLPLAALNAATAKDKTCDLTVSSDQGSALLDMRTELSQVLADLKPGEISPIVGIKAVRWAAVLIAWEDGPPPSLANARDTIASAWQNDRLRLLLQQKLAPLEQAAEIRVFDDPAPAADPESVFQQILKKSPDSPVALLAVFWQQVLAKSPDSAASFERLLATRALDAPSLTQLEKALRTRGLTSLADRAKAATPTK